MPKFVYIGTAHETTVFGLTFTKGEAVEVTEEYAVGKLTTNPHFKAAELEAEGQEEVARKRGKGKAEE